VDGLARGLQSATATAEKAVSAAGDAASAAAEANSRQAAIEERVQGRSESSIALLAHDLEVGLASEAEARISAVESIKNDSESRENSILEKVSSLVTQDDLLVAYQEAKAAGADAGLEAGKQAAIAVATEKIEHANFFGIGRAAAASMGWGGPLGLGIGLAGWFVGRRLKRRAANLATPASPLPQQAAPPDALTESDRLHIRLFGRRDSEEPDTVLNDGPDSTAEVESVALPRLDADYAKLWADHIERTGGSVADEAAKRTLFLEAIKRLRLGELGAAKEEGRRIADQLESWVAKAFYERNIQVPRPDDNIYHRGLQAFLYRSAIEKLRSGEILSKNHVEVADRIEDWVRREFMTRATKGN